jgi:hypothetical protein
MAGAMDEPERTPDDPGDALTKLISALPDKPTRRCRTYVLEQEDGHPVFRCIDPGPAAERCEIDIAITEAIDELFGGDIVPRKLAQQFPGRSTG